MSVFRPHFYLYIRIKCLFLYLFDHQKYAKNVTHPKAKPLKGFTSVMKIQSTYKTNTYRSIYTTKINEKIYVLHAFQKKSKKGIQTPKKEIDLIKHRLKIAQDLAKGE